MYLEFWSAKSFLFKQDKNPEAIKEMIDTNDYIKVKTVWGMKNAIKKVKR